MSDVITIALISAGAALMGALLGAIPSLLLYRLRQRELDHARVSRLHHQTVELLKINLDRVKLLEHSKGMYATHDSPMILYYKFFQWLRNIEYGEHDLPEDIREYLSKEIESMEGDPEKFGLNRTSDQPTGPVAEG